MLDTLIGKTILNEFTITRKIGAGAFATVYLAKQEHMDRYVVAKITHPHLVEGTMASMVQARFQDEVRAASRVKHQNLITIFTSGQVMGCPTLIMEYVEGVPLEMWLMEQRAMDMDVCAPLFMQIASALSSLHKAGIVHRDLSPRNIMMSPTPDGGHKAVLLDFGIAQLDGNTRYTLGPLGTPRYMSPEQAQGESSAASDMYSLGAMLWWALTGKQYLEHLNSFGEIFKFQMKQSKGMDPRKLNSSIHPELARMVSSLLSINPLHRPTAEKFLTFWQNHHTQNATLTRSALAQTDQYQSIHPNQSFTSLDVLSSPEHSMTVTQNQQVYLINTGDAHNIVSEVKDALGHLAMCTEVESLWELDATNTPVPQTLLLCVNSPQTALMLINIFREMPISKQYKLTLVTPSTNWSEQLSEVSRVPTFELPKQAITLQKHLALSQSLGPESSQQFIISPQTGPFAKLHRNTLSHVTEPENLEQTIDWVTVRKHHNASPAQTASYISAFIGEMPNILAELEHNLNNPQEISRCCETIIKMSKPLGMKQMLRLSNMLAGFAQHGLLDDLQGPYDELEDAYAECFQELMEFQKRHIQITHN